MKKKTKFGTLVIQHITALSKRLKTSTSRGTSASAAEGGGGGGGASLSGFVPFKVERASRKNMLCIFLLSGPSAFTDFYLFEFVRKFKGSFMN